MTLSTFAVMLLEICPDMENEQWQYLLRDRWKKYCISSSDFICYACFSECFIGKPNLCY